MSHPAPPRRFATAGLADALPAGPFESSDKFCRAWMTNHNRDVEKLERRCADQPDAEDCQTECGFESRCTPDAQGTGALGPFRAAEIVTTFTPCGPGDCYLALTTDRGTWFVAQVPQCSSGEGFVANLATTSLAFESGALVWRYEHDYGTPPDEQHEDGTLRCTPTAGTPACD